MDRRERLIKILKACIPKHLGEGHDCPNCPRLQEVGITYMTSSCMIDVMTESLAVLELHEVKPSRRGSGMTWYYCCGSCDQPIDPGDSFCRRCGEKVKWE